MSDVPKLKSAALDPAILERIGGIAADYDAAWRASAGGQTPPPIDTFLDRILPEYREALRLELQDIQQSYRTQQTLAEGTPTGTIEIGPDASKADTAQAASNGTILYPDVAKADTAQAASDGTIIFPIPGGSPPADGKGLDRTLEHQSGSGGLGDVDLSMNVDLAMEVGASMVHVPGYEIVGELGRGGMGVVYKARQLGLNRWVALKMVLAGAHASEMQLRRFLAEAEAVAGLQHPNIVQIYDIGRHGGLPYFSLEFVNGGSLSDKVHRQPQPPPEAAHLVETLARAMGYAHEHGIIHRDLKPANVLMTANGIPKITDFGLAKKLEDDSSQTKSGTLLGTPSYMSPEQARGEIHSVGPRSDIYALGAMLYELLTGRPPFQAPTPMETLVRVTRDEPPAPSRLQANIPADIETICLKCLQKEPAKRYGTAEALAEDLRRFLSGEPILARPISAPARLWRWCKRHPQMAVSAAVIFLLLLVVSIGSTWAAFTISKEKNTAIEARNEAREQADLALETVTRLLTNVQDRLQTLPGQQARAVRRHLLQGALDDLKRVANRISDESAKQRNFGRAFLKMGIAAKELGNSEEAYDYFKRCYRLVKDALEGDQENDQWRVMLSSACMELGELSQKADRDIEKSLAYYQENISLREKIAAVPDEERRRRNEKLKTEDRLNPFISRLMLSEAYLRVALTNYYAGDSAKAEAPILRCLKIREGMIAELLGGQASWCVSGTIAGGVPISILGSVPFQKSWASNQRQNLARNYHLAAEIYLRLRDRSKSGSYYGKVVEIREALHAEDPDDYQLLGDLAEFYIFYGDMYFKLGDPQSALPKYDRSIELGREIVAKDNNVQYLRNLGTALYSRGLATLRTNGARGTKYFQESLQIREELAQKDRKSEEEKMNLMLILAQSGRQSEAAAIAEAVRIGRDKDQELLVTIARGYAECAATSTGDPKRKRSYDEKAIAALQAAVAGGYKDLMILETDPDLYPIRDLPEFKKLLERMKIPAATATATRR